MMDNYYYGKAAERRKETEQTLSEIESSNREGCGTETSIRCLEDRRE